MKEEKIFVAFVNLEEPFDRVARRILWWTTQKLRIDEWIIQLVKSMYDNAHSKVGSTNSYSNPINVSAGVHQGSVQSPLHFSLFREFRTGCPWELLYADDLVIVAQSLSELNVRLKN